jgi:hypothetical protein
LDLLLELLAQVAQTVQLRHLGRILKPGHVHRIGRKALDVDIMVKKHLPVETVMMPDLQH